MRFGNYCIPFLFTICTVSQLFWNRVCRHYILNRLIQTTMCRIHIHILSTHSVLLCIFKVINTHYTPYVHILHYVHIYTHINMRRCNRLYISYVSWMCNRTIRFFVFVQCVRVVQLNCVKVKVQCMAYR